MLRLCIFISFVFGKWTNARTLNNWVSEHVCLIRAFLWFRKTWFNKNIDKYEVTNKFALNNKIHFYKEKTGLKRISG